MISTRKLHRTAQLPVFCGRSKSLSRHLFLRATCANSTKERFQKLISINSKIRNLMNRILGSVIVIVLSWSCIQPFFLNLSEYVLIEIYDLRVVTTAVPHPSWAPANSSACLRNRTIAGACSSENISTVAFSKKLLLSFVQGLAGCILNNDLLLSFCTLLLYCAITFWLYKLPGSSLVRLVPRCSIGV